MMIYTLQIFTACVTEHNLVVFASLELVGMKALDLSLTLLLH